MMRYESKRVKNRSSTLLIEPTYSWPVQAVTEIERKEAHKGMLQIAREGRETLLLKCEEKGSQKVIQPPPSLGTFVPMLKFAWLSQQLGHTDTQAEIVEKVWKINLGRFITDLICCN